MAKPTTMQERLEATLSMLPGALLHGLLVITVCAQVLGGLALAAVALILAIGLAATVWWSSRRLAVSALASRVFAVSLVVNVVVCVAAWIWMFFLDHDVLFIQVMTGLYLPVQAAVLHRISKRDTQAYLWRGMADSLSDGPGISDRSAEVELNFEGEGEKEAENESAASKVGERRGL